LCHRITSDRDDVTVDRHRVAPDRERDRIGPPQLVGRDDRDRAVSVDVSIRRLDEVDPRVVAREWLVRSDELVEERDLLLLDTAPSDVEDRDPERPRRAALARLPPLAKLGVKPDEIEDALDRPARAAASVQLERVLHELVLRLEREREPPLDAVDAMLPSEETEHVDREVVRLEPPIDLERRDRASDCVELRLHRLARVSDRLVARDARREELEERHVIERTTHPRRPRRRRSRSPLARPRSRRARRRPGP